MKKYSAITLLLLLTSVISHAQIRTSLGFKGGAAFSKFNGKSISSAETSVGPTIGGFASLGFADFLDFQFEMLYTQMGGSYRYDSVSYDPKLSYLEFPLLLKIKIPLGGSVYPFAYIGESAGFKIGETTNQKAAGGTLKPAGDQFSSLNLSTIYGVGVDFVSDFVVLTLDFRYGNGMINVLNNGEGQTSQYSLSAGFGFKLSKEKETPATD